MNGVPQLWSLSAASDELGISVSTLRKQIQKGHLESWLLDGQYYVTDASVVAFLDKVKNKKSNFGRKKLSGRNLAKKEKEDEQQYETRNRQECFGGMAG